MHGCSGVATRARTPKGASIHRQVCFFPAVFSMANPEHVEIVKMGVEVIRQWREDKLRKLLDPSIIEQRIVDFRLSDCGSFDLIDANLKNLQLSQADLSLSQLNGADLTGANLLGANLRSTDFFAANLSNANLSGANLSGSDCCKADLTGANLSGANFNEANLSFANLSSANFRAANLFQANLIGANFCGADLHGTNLKYAHCDGTVFGNVDLSTAIGVDAIRHLGPSIVGIDTLQRSKGQIAEEFLLSCCLTRWAILQARMYDPTLTQDEISELQLEIFEQRSSGCL